MTLTKQYIRRVLWWGPVLWMVAGASFALGIHKREPFDPDWRLYFIIGAVLLIDGIMSIRQALRFLSSLPDQAEPAPAVEPAAASALAK